MRGRQWRFGRSDSLALIEIAILNPMAMGVRCPVCGEESVHIADEDSGLDWTGESRYSVLLRCHECGAMFKETWQANVGERNEGRRGTNGADSLVKIEITLLDPEPLDGTCPLCGDDRVEMAAGESGFKWVDRNHYRLWFRCNGCGAFLEEVWRTGED